jgi:2-dehydro-3-deoxygalactonokinase
MEVNRNFTFKSNLPPMQESSFLSVDWGTTNLRIRWVSLPGFDVLAEKISDQGVKKVFLRWQESSIEREPFFLRVLLSELQTMDFRQPAPVKMIISGMASSSIGMRELPYAPLPFFTNGQALFVEKWWPPGFPHEISLISGVSSQDDVMRGEETQLVGLCRLLRPSGNALFILPGTHSKHIYLEDEAIFSFHTFMTGEVFDVLSAHSILNGSIDKGPLDRLALAAFKNGVLMSMEKSSILNALFMVRTNALFEKFSKRENYYFLSGLLIGAECNYLIEKNLDQIYICSSGILFSLYLEAANILGIPMSSQMLTDAMVDLALLNGQWFINECQAE